MSASWGECVGGEIRVQIEETERTGSGERERELREYGIEIHRKRIGRLR